MCCTIMLWVLGILFFGGIALYTIATLLFVDERRPDEIHYIKTKDGWDIGIRRIRPKTEKAQATPVLLQHGLGANHRDFDLDDTNSLALYLARAGYDCFVPDLRGNGLSRYRQAGWPNKWHIGFEDFVEQDMPAIIDKVLEETGAKQLHYIGHSMGAMVGYATLMTDRAKKVKSMISFAGPAMFEAMGHFKKALRYRKLLNFFPVIHTDFFNRLLSPLAYLFPVLGKSEVNPENMERLTLAKGGSNVISPIPRKLLLQFGAWVEFGEWGAHLPVSYQSQFGKITTPLYCLAGTVDFWCPQGAIAPVIERISSTKKRMRFFAKANGDRADYGHGDIVVGREAPRDIFPTALDWLQEIDQNA